MNREAPALTVREEDVLRLILGGHDAKSAAQMLSLSRHTVNEYLRTARMKLGVTSSREAARRFGALLGESPNSLVPNDFGDARLAEASQKGAAQARSGSLTIMIGASLATAVAIGFGAFLAGAVSAPSASVPPKVVSTLPSEGAVVASGPFTLKVTFDRPMQSGSVSFATGNQPAFPQCRGAPIQSADGRSFSLNCLAKPGQSYVVWFNHGRFMNFKSKDGAISAQPTRLTFRVAYR